eukprot:TRINITY_DN11885_c0_g1_i1.p5 TRINITY_DN11885_c0_g1~~TRINITY_DN11885_c0_g1_i1.p5  ORF type:complete len:116 (-),score=3.18 TRINITY_DN11885_c0_g1_i1:312-659(-)
MTTGLLQPRKGGVFQSSKTPLNVFKNKKLYHQEYFEIKRDSSITILHQSLSDNYQQNAKKSHANYAQTKVFVLYTKKKGNKTFKFAIPTRNKRASLQVLSKTKQPGNIKFFNLKP